MQLRLERCRVGERQGARAARRAGAAGHAARTSRRGVGRQ